MDDSFLHGARHRDVLLYYTIKPVAFIGKGLENGENASPVFTLNYSGFI